MSKKEIDNSNREPGVENVWPESHDDQKGGEWGPKRSRKKNPTILWFSFYMMMTIMTYRQRKANNKNENVNETIQKFDWVRGEMPQRQKGRKNTKVDRIFWLYFCFIQVFVIF